MSRDYLEILVKIDKSISARWHKPGLSGMKRHRQHTHAPDHPVASQHFQRHKQWVACKVAKEIRNRQKNSMITYSIKQ